VQKYNLFFNSQEKFKIFFFFFPASLFGFLRTAKVSLLFINFKTFFEVFFKDFLSVFPL
jgi:hypothetical protein